MSSMLQINPLKITTHSKPRSVCSGYSATLYSTYFLFIGNTSFPCRFVEEKSGLYERMPLTFYKDTNFLAIFALSFETNI